MRGGGGSKYTTGLQFLSVGGGEGNNRIEQGGGVKIHDGAPVLVSRIGYRLTNQPLGMKPPLGA